MKSGRINELARDTGYKHPVHVGQCEDLCKRFDVEQFARLIIQECIDIAKCHVMNISTYDNAESVEKQIIGHFGIEDKAEEFENWCKESDDGGDDEKNT